MEVLTMFGKTTALCSALAAGISFAASADEAESPVFKEVRIMAKVLEESLDQSGAGQWSAVSAGVSFFEPRVRAQYVPTVGAMFTVQLAFPIVPPKPGEDASDAEKPEEPQDLWKRFENTAAGPQSPVAAVRTRDAVKAREPDGDRRVVVHKDGDGVVIDESGELKQVLGEAQKLMKEINVVIADEIRTAQLYGFQRAYDERKVADLRKAVIETVAKYAWRMENVPYDERVLVIVEAPKPRPPSTFRASPRARVESRDGRPWVDTWLGPLLDLSQDTGRARIGFDLTDTGARDRLLFSFNKSDLFSETTYDDLAPKMRETAY
jgi:hypothetical protein